MEKKATFGKEELFISEFSDDFFKKRLQSDDGLEDFIRECSDEVENREKKGGVWHCILDVAVEKICKKGLGSYFDFNKYFGGDYGLQKIMAGFYGEPFFLKLDVAQAITYNLCRLGKEDVYDMEDGYDVKIWEEDFRGILDIGRKMPEKDLAVDLIPGLERLEEKYNDAAERSRVRFPRMADGGKITLEQNFSGLNVLYIGNERFQTYLSRSGPKKAYFKDFMGYIAVLDKVGNEPQQYVWEKMTGFNAINIMAKFLTEMAGKGGCSQRKDVRNFMESLMKDHSYLFRQIMEMPNVLTRLLFLKQVFAYGFGMEDNMKWGYLQNINRLLFGKNDRYKEIRESILETAVYTRWMMGGGLDIGTWQRELEKEYPIEVFEELLLSVNIGDGWHCMKDAGVDLEEMKGEEGTAYLFLELKRKGFRMDGLCRYERKCRLLQNIKDFKYFEYSRELAVRLLGQGWFHKSSGNLLKPLNGELERMTEQTPLGRICSIKDHSELAGEEYEKFMETAEELEKALRPCLLSNYKNVIFENTYMEEEKVYEEIINYLLYHILK